MNVKQSKRGLLISSILFGVNSFTYAASLINQTNFPVKINIAAQKQLELKQPENGYVYYIVEDSNNKVRGLLTTDPKFPFGNQPNLMCGKWFFGAYKGSNPGSFRCDGSNITLQ